LADLITEIRVANPTSLGELFEIKQGARAGLRDAFILSEEQLLALPAEERTGFRPVAENDTLFRGHILRGAYAFYPGVEFDTEDELNTAYPAYFNTYLLPKKDKLSSRAKIKRWWEMTWPRNWLREMTPRLVTPMFSDAGSFALDATGRYVICQGYGWLPKRLAEERNPLDRDRLRTLKLYCALFNTKFFFQLLREFSTNVAGGQIDLAPKYVNLIPAPSWRLIERRLPAVPSPTVVQERIARAENADTPAYSMDEDTALRLYGLSPEVVLGRY
jgi:hypothetical protein